jgi:hypothetical protein
VTPTARSVTRTCAALGTLGIVLSAGPAWALDLPTPGLPTAGLPSPGLPAGPAVPVATPTLLPGPVATLLPTPVASALAPVTSRLPGGEPSARPAPSPTPAPPATQPRPAPASAQEARSESALAPLAASLALRADRGETAQLRSLPGVVAPVEVAPVPVSPQLAPAAAAAPVAGLPRPPAPDGLPAVIVALAIGAVSAAAAGQVAEVHARRAAGR